MEEIGRGERDEREGEGCRKKGRRRGEWSGSGMSEDQKNTF